MADKFPDRVRFNWGFHDGTAEAVRKNLRDMADHFDKVYAAGYLAGVKAYGLAGVRPESSDEAWQAYQLAEGSPYCAIAQRIVNARVGLVANLAQLGKIDEAAANKAADFYIKHKLVKLDAVGGRYSVKNGIFFDAVVIQRAAVAA